MNSNVVEYGQKNCQAVGSLLYHSRLRQQVFFFTWAWQAQKTKPHPKNGQAQAPKMGRLKPHKMGRAGLMS